MDYVISPNAPTAIGPYSQAIKANGFIFCSGQIPMKVDGTLVEGDIVAQANQVLTNLKAVLIHAGSGMEQVVKTTVYLSDMNNFAAMNEVYAKHFGDHKPARATIQAAALPKNVLIEIDCVALAS